MKPLTAHNGKIPGARTGSPATVPMARWKTVAEVFGTQQAIGRT